VGRLFERLKHDYPLIRLRVYEAYSGQIEDWLANGRIEIGLFHRFRAGRVRGAEKVLQSELMLVSREATRRRGTRKSRSAPSAACRSRYPCARPRLSPRWPI